MEDRRSNAARQESSYDKEIKRGVERTNAKMRHFRGIAASVMEEALKVWGEMWEDCQEPGTFEEIVEGVDKSAEQMPAGGWSDFREKLHLLRNYIDFTKRLCDGSIDNSSKGEK